MVAEYRLVMAGSARRVFLSHTSELREFPVGRSFVDAAEAAVSRAGGAVADMAYFSAGEDKPSVYCQEMVRGCDVYIGLIGLRYGSPVRDRPDASYTELEFDTATEAGLQRLIFMLDEDAAVPVPPTRLLDREVDRQVRQRAFRARLLDAGVMIRRFSSPEGLELEVLQALQSRRAVLAPRAGQVARLPARPALVGRTAEVDALVGAWLATPPEPVAVQGAPGIGKSTVCLAALHDERVREHFRGRRWFVRCDGARSADALWSVLAAGLGVIGEGSPGTLVDRVCTALGTGLAVVVLDNFETPWMADPLAVEELLRTVGATPQVALAISVRGTARPAGLRWRDFAMLSPLTLPDARALFLAVAGAGSAADPQLDGLLTELDGVPLAVELLGYAAQGQSSLREVAERWRRERTGMLRRMTGDRRELNVAVSVDTSVTAPLMTAGGRRLLALLSVLPDGATHDDLVALLPESARPAAAVLRQLGLAFDDGDRLRALAPIREHIAASLRPEPADLDRAVGHYAQLAAIVGDQIGRRDGNHAVVRLQAETGNIAAMLAHAAADGRISRLAAGIHGLVDYWRYTGLIQPELVAIAEHAIKAHGNSVQQASTWLALGDLSLARSDLDGARDHYDDALSLFQQAGDQLGEANGIKSLGDIALRRSDLDGAWERYEQALPLYQQAGDLLGEANCVKSLGDIGLRRSDRRSAGSRYEQALLLYRNVGEVLGEANCIKSLGDIALRRSDHDRAHDRYERALTLYQQAGSQLGQANCIKSLADIALRRSGHDQARALYDQALPLYRKVGDVLGQANCLRNLGDIALRGTDYDSAWERYEQALHLYQQVGDLLGQANCIKSQGSVALRQSDYHKAHGLYRQALPLYQQVGSLLGEANCIKSLGDIALRQSDRTSARARYEQALALYLATTAPYAVGWTHVRLARLASSSRLRTRHWNAAREAWDSIGRNDLITSISAEFQ
jgi:tetratricopeptide (TPR) repeat protein